MLGIKIIIYAFIFITTSGIGILKSKKYSYRVDELKDFKTALNIFKTKIKYTYKPLPEIFSEISVMLNSNIGKMFELIKQAMKVRTAPLAWEYVIDNNNLLNITEEDKIIIKSLGNLLGQTDVEGQINQIELTNTFLDKQILEAEKLKQKNEKLYRTLGMAIGLAIVIILM